MKGIILAGGSGTRLHPITKVTSKQLLPIYDKPMIYYPLSVLMMAGIRDILIISTPDDTPRFSSLFGDGHQFGINIEYQIQPEPKGLAQAFTIGRDFIGTDCVSMILGDNIFYGNGFQNHLNRANEETKQGKATIFGYYVNDPERFGVVEFDADGQVISIEEKPEIPKSNYAATGLYFYDNRVVDYARDLKPSKRNELEITDINKIYLQDNTLRVEVLGRGFSWLDTGTQTSLLEASNFICQTQKSGQLIGSPEEIAYLKGWITDEQLIYLGEQMKNSPYGKTLVAIAKDKKNDPLRVRKLES